MSGRRVPAPPIRIVNYAVNGLGLGHLTRLIAVNRQIRRIASVLGEHTEIVFVTSSEGDGLAYQHGFASFHIPSKSVVATCDLDPARYRKLAKQWVWNTINLCSPDILLVDTFPGGGFGELYDILDFGQRNAFVYRAVREEAASEPSFQEALKAYDLIAMPTEFGRNDSPVPAEVADRVVRTGQVLLRSREEMLPRDEARATLGLGGSSPAVYVSMGGGGDRHAQGVFRAVVEAAARLPEVEFVIGAGALYRGAEPSAPNVRWTRRPMMGELFSAFDAAVTAGGYNSVWELMHAGVPCAFLPQARGFDDQEQRAEGCVAAGAGVMLPSLAPEALARAVRHVLVPETRTAFAAAARRLVPRNCAIDLAEAVLTLVLPENDVESAAEVIDDAALRASAGRGGREEVVLEAAGHLLRLGDGAEPDDCLPVASALLGRAAENGVAHARVLRALRRRKARAPLGDIAEETIASLVEPPQLESGPGTARQCQDVVSNFGAPEVRP